MPAKFSLYKNKHQSIRHATLDSCFQNYGREYSIDDLLAEVNTALTEYDPKSSGIQLRTLRSDISFMRNSSGYDAPIEVYQGSSGNYYRYSDKSFSISKSPLNITEAEQLKSALSVLQRFEGSPKFEWVNEIGPLLNDKFGLRGTTKKVMSFESNIDYAGYSFISTIFNAIINKCSLRISYAPFKGDAYEVNFHPYFLKQYNNRWFAFGYNEFNNIPTWNLALDRIKKIEERTGEKYIPDSTDWEEYFDDIIGVSKDCSQKPEEIKIIFKSDQAPYILTKPLHRSQKNRLLESGELEIRIFIIPNFELETMIMSFGERAYVKSPPYLKQAIAERAKLLTKNY